MPGAAYTPRLASHKVAVTASGIAQRSGSDGWASAEAKERAAARAEREHASAVRPLVGSGGSVYYKNRTAVRAAGKAPIYAGRPGYSRKLDRNGDGIGCE